MSRKPADFSLPISLLQVAGVPGVRRCRSASTMIFACFLHNFFDTYFSIVFSHVSYFFFSGEPSPTRILLQPASVKTISPFSKKLIFFKHAFLKTRLKLASFSHRLFMKFHYFLGIDFRIDFFIVFLMKKDPQKYPISSLRGVHFRIFFATLSFMLVLY